MTDERAIDGALPQVYMTSGASFSDLASLFESGWADAHSDHRDAELWSDPYYRGGYLAGATRPFPVEPSVQDATRAALDIEGISSASFRTSGTRLTGVMSDDFTSMEYDVLHDPATGWNVNDDNDDNGDDWKASTLEAAIVLARGNGQTWYVVSRHKESGMHLVRTWTADDYEHAIEQHNDSFNNPTGDDSEEAVCASITEPMFYGSVQA